MAYRYKPPETPLPSLGKPRLVPIEEARNPFIAQLFELGVVRQPADTSNAPTPPPAGDQQKG